jgi:Na+/proline symporter
MIGMIPYKLNISEVVHISRKEPLIAGLIVGIVSGILMVEYTNHFGALTSSLFNIPIFGSLYVAVVALAFNLIISFGGSFIMNKKRSSFGRIN